jgi:hypothetical protein
MQLAKKWLKVAPGVIFIFLRNKIPYQKQDETQKLFLEDLVLLMVKGFSPLNTCENVHMQRLALRLDPKVVFPFRKTLSKKILPNMVTRCLELHVQPLLDATPTITTTFDLWMNRGQLWFLL